VTQQMTQESRSAVRALFILGAVVLAGIGVVLGIMLLVDRDASSNLSALLYELIGNDAEAQALRRGGGDRLVAKLILAAVALVLGVGGIWLFYAGLNWLAERFSPETRKRVLPWVFVGPALVLLTVYLVFPAVSTVIMSLTEDDGIGNYGKVLTNPDMLVILRNNLVWLVVGVAGAVGLGLLIAGLLDRIKHESVAKTFIFLPMAISLVGASAIWRFVYAWRPEGANQIGVLNAIWTSLGGEPVLWLQQEGINTFLLIVILIWVQTGFAMVVLSAAIKGVPTEIIEAAALDGANERQKFLRIIVPMIKGSLTMVTVTTAIVVLKVFDIVNVTTGGNFGTDVIANQMIRQLFQFRNFGQAAVLAVILFIAVLPLLIYNVRTMRRQGVGS